MAYPAPARVANRSIQRRDPFSRLPDELLGAVLLRTFNGTRFTETSDDDADLRESIAVELQKGAPFRAFEFDIPEAAIPLAFPGPAASSLAPFHHALVSKRWLRVARSSHPAIIIPRDRFFSAETLASLLCSRFFFSSSGFSNLRHLHLGEFALDLVSDKFLLAVAAGKDDHSDDHPPLENLTHLTLHLYNRRPSIFPPPVAPVFPTADAVSALLRTCRRLVYLKLVWERIRDPRNEPQSITAFPESVTVLGQLRELTLEGTFSALPEEFGQLARLQRLRIAAGKLAMLPRTFCLLTSLEVLALFRCPMTHLPDDLGQLKKLSSIRIADMDSLQDLPASISLLAALTQLTLECCYGLLLPMDLQLPPHLRKVVLERLDEDTLALPDSLGELKALEELEILEFKYLEQLPRVLSHSSSLRRLTIGVCEHLSLPDDIGELCNLEHLVLFCCNFTSLPDSLGWLPALKELVISGCIRFQYLPQSVAALESLTTLFLNGDGVIALPEDFGQLTRLVQLELVCESLAILPESFGQLQGLKVLRLIECVELGELPASFSNLTALEELSICGAESLTSLPLGFERLLQLRKLELLGCAVAELPEMFGKMVALDVLEVGDSWRYYKHVHGDKFGLGNIHRGPNGAPCALSTLPHSFTLLTHLQRLIFDGCENLTQLPHEIGNLSSLRELRLKDCKLLRFFPPLLLTAPASHLRRSARIAHMASTACPPLPELRHLVISMCPVLKHLPDGLHRLPKLESVTVHDCQQLRLPPQTTLAPHQPPSTRPTPGFFPPSVTSISISGAFVSDENLAEFLNFSPLSHLHQQHHPSAHPAQPVPSAETPAPAPVDPLGGPPPLVRAGLNQLASLQSLSIVKTRITSLPDFLSDLVNLRAMTIAECAGIASLPSSITSLPNLQQLRIRSLPLLSSLPKSTGELTGLQELTVTSCAALRRLPRSLSQLSSLICMIIDDCPQIATIPSSISSLTRLTFLKLSCLPALRKLPSSLSHLPSLVKLSLQYCTALQALPSDLGSAPRLRELQLHGCQGLTPEALPSSLLEKASMYRGLNSMSEGINFMEH